MYKCTPTLSTQDKTHVLLQVYYSNSAMQIIDDQKVADQYSQQQLSDAWAGAAHQLACAQNSHDKNIILKSELMPNQMVCLADMLADNHGFRSIKLKLHGMNILLLPHQPVVQ